MKFLVEIDMLGGVVASSMEYIIRTELNNRLKLKKYDFNKRGITVDVVRLTNLDEQALSLVSLIEQSIEDRIAGHEWNTHNE